MKGAPATPRVPALEPDGFEIHAAVFGEAEVERMRREADRVAAVTGSACVRHLRSNSVIFARLANCPQLRGLLEPELSPVRSILFDKTPEENWPVAWHQDLTIAVAERRDADGYGPWSTKGGVPHTQPPVGLLQSMVTLRIHLDPTPESNGALRLVPGSHLRGRIPPDDIRSHGDAEEVTAECGPGDVLAMRPLALHSSRRSARPARRRVIHFEYADRAALDPSLEWHEPR